MDGEHFITYVTEYSALESIATFRFLLQDFIKEKSKAESDQESGADDDDKEWSSWGNEPESIMCLFCKHICRSWDGALLHMLVSHNFEFKSQVSQFNFYQQVSH